MGVHRGSAHDARLRAAALLLTCALALALGTVGRAAHGHKHLPRGVVAVATTSVDQPAGSARGELSAVPAPAAPVAALSRLLGGTADASAPVRSGTAQAPQVRGPPAQAAV